MLWAAAMGIKVGGLSRTVAQPRPHADRLPNEDSSCDSRHECVPRAATRPLACTVCSTRVRAGIRAKFCTIMLGISSFEVDFVRIAVEPSFFYRKEIFIDRVNVSLVLRAKSWKLLNDPSRILLVFQLEIYIPFNFWWIGRNSKSSRDLEIKEVYVVFNKLYKLLLKFLKRD